MPRIEDDGPMRWMLDEERMRLSKRAEGGRRTKAKARLSKPWSVRAQPAASRAEHSRESATEIVHEVSHVRTRRRTSKHALYGWGQAKDHSGHLIFDRDILP